MSSQEKELECMAWQELAQVPSFFIRYVFIFSVKFACQISNYVLEKNIRPFIQGEHDHWWQHVRETERVDNEISPEVCFSVTIH